MNMIKFTIAIIALVFSLKSFAGINDPWYAMYKVSGGTIIQTMGPYSNRIECMSARFQIPFGAEFLGCAQ